ncbi:MAG: outer membrane lipoprotein carrier protein LolA [Bacilli bacterium]|nr:outer membrane lipoprotein carrier protein LolA [Bacilli bacterium]
MKKKIFLASMICFCILLSGCGKKDEKYVIKKMKNKIEKTTGYHATGDLEIYNNEDVYKYDVDVSYEKDDKYRVSLKNKTNNHEQIILKNNDGVYVLTPSLNKSFKFQSDWPYNNSQAYLFQTVLNDITNDSKRTFNLTKDGYEIISKVNYSNNKNLKKQKVYINKNNEIEKVEILDDEDNVKMRMIYKDTDMKATYNKNYFSVKENMSGSTASKNNSQVSKLDDTTYPMYIPTNTTLSSQDKVSIENGERIIMTFSGEKPFMLIQEVSTTNNDLTTIPTNGDIEFLGDSIAILNDNSLTWYSDGVEYYLVSDKLNEEELISVANSVSSIPIGK